MGLRGTTTVDPNAAFALDANALTSLREQAKRAPADALSKAAGQFEALFVSMVLKSMRDALPQDGLLSNETTKTYTAMFDQQLALKLSERGIGLRKALEKQLAKHLPPADPASASPSASKPAADITTIPAAKARIGERASLRAPQTIPTPASNPAQAPHGNEHSTAPLSDAISSFVDKLRPHAEAAAKALGVPVQFLLAQAGLETGWGKSQPKAADGVSSHNVFGVKAGRQYAGNAVAASTTEYVAGTPIRSTERFRSYGSYADSFQDFVRLLKDNPRYAKVLASGGDANGYAQSLQRAGYATDPAYAAKLTRAIALVTRHTGAPAPAQVLAGNADTSSDRA